MTKDDATDDDGATRTAFLDNLTAAERAHVCKVVGEALQDDDLIALSGGARPSWRASAVVRLILNHDTEIDAEALKRG